MAAITLYRDEECTDVVGSGLIGAWNDIYGGVPSVHIYADTQEIDGKNVDFNMLRGFGVSTVKQGEPTEIVIPYTETDTFQRFYITPDCGFTLKVVKTGTNSGAISNGVFFRKINGTEHNFGEIGDTFACYMNEGVICKLIFRTGKKAHYNNYGTDVLIDNTNFFGFDVLYFDQQGRDVQRRGYMIIAPSDVFITDSGTEPYKPETGNARRGGTGSGYYPNNPIPALPTGALNAAFSSVLGSGNGLTYYKLTGASLSEITEFLYDCSLSLKFRNSQYRDAIASLIFIPYDVPAQITNSLGLVYLANKSIPVSGGCDIIKEPFVEIDFGTVDLTAGNIGFKSFADYIYTSASLYLPCFGSINIDMSALASGILHVRAVIDCRNGNILYRVETQGELDSFPVLYGQYNGNAGIPVPIGGANNGVSLLGAAASIGNVAVGFATGNPLNIVGGASSFAEQTAPTIDTSGALQPAGAAMGTPTPVLQIRKKVLLQPPQWEEIAGRPSGGANSADQYHLRDFAGGFVQAAFADVSGISGATDQEKAEIEQLLRGGVFV